MNYVSFEFLFIFLPFAIILFLLAEKRYRPYILLVFSVIFYIGGGANSIGSFVFLLLINYGFGYLIEIWHPSERGRFVLVLGIIINLSVLVLYKLIFVNGSAIFKKLLPFYVEGWFQNIVFPLGVSYLCFQLISYLIDVYKGSCKSERDIFKFSLYTFFFPKLLSGPITPYRSFFMHATDRSFDWMRIKNGLRRLSIGLAKKVLIADHLARTVNAAFGLETPNFGTGVAWLVLVGFALQLFFDFSGYIDMALGMGEVFGIQLPENFNYPYISRSISEFWRRWHISLSSWFREYVFFPLERHRLPFLGQQINILIVFILTGLWHGLTPMYLIWGLIHGMAIAAESTFLGRLLRKTWYPIQHVYTLSIILFSWIFFRSDSLRFSWLFIKRLFGNTSGITTLPFSQTRPLPFIEPTFILALTAGLIFSLPISNWLENLYARFVANKPRVILAFHVFIDLITLILLWMSIAALASGGFLPGIYDRF